MRIADEYLTLNILSANQEVEAGKYSDWPLRREEMEAAKQGKEKLPNMPAAIMPAEESRGSRHDCVPWIL